MINKIVFIVLLLWGSACRSENLTYMSNDFFGGIEECSLAEKTIKFDEIQSFYTYGMCHYDEMLNDEGLEKTIANLRKAAALGYTRAYIDLGKIQAFSSENFDRLEGAATLRMASTKFPKQGYRYLGIYFLNERFSHNYSKPLAWSKYYLEKAYEKGDFASAYILVYAIKNKIFESTEHYNEWMKKGNHIDRQEIGYEKVILSLKETGYLLEATNE